jgi:hypothetical protein
MLVGRGRHARAAVREATMNDERRGAVILGVLLILVGGAFFLSDLTGFRLDAAWPLFVIIPGVVLFSAAFLVGGEAGTGFAIAGAIVTMVGLVLSFQEATGLYATWSYAWALVAPTGPGLGLLVYGLATRQPKLASAGLPLVGVGLALFLGFALFFEGVIGLSGDRIPAIRDLLPLGLILLGGVLVVGSVLRRGRA